MFPAKEAPASSHMLVSRAERGELDTPVLAHRAGNFFSIIIGVSSDLPTLGVKGWALRGVLPGRMYLSASQYAFGAAATGSVSPEQHGPRLRWFFEPNCGAR